MSPILARLPETFYQLRYNLQRPFLSFSENDGLKLGILRPQHDPRVFPVILACPLVAFIPFDRVSLSAFGAD